MPRPDIVAHRGGSAFPENSFAAFRHACTLGVEQVEFDIHLTKDGELVIIHDTDLEQTTLAAGPVRALTLAELAKVRLRRIDECVPSFDDVMAFLATQKIHVRIEIKSAAGPGVYEKIHALVMRTLTRHRFLARATIMAFDAAALLPFCRDGVNTSLSWMRHGQTTPDEFDRMLAQTAALGINDIGLSFGPTTLAILERVASHNLTAGVWTVNDPARLDYWLGMPVAYILTDHPQLALDLYEGK